MYVSDQKSLAFLAGLALVVGPWLGGAYQAWSWLLEVLLLLSLFWVGRSEKGPVYATGYLGLGYMIVLLFDNISVEDLSFIPLAGIVVLWGLKRGWRQREVVFAGLVTAAIAGVIPTLFFMQGVPQDYSQSVSGTLLEQYRQAGMLDMLKRQGMSEADALNLITETVSLFILVTPGMSALFEMALFSSVYYIFARWFPLLGQRYIPYRFWRLPWYAVWGMILAVSCYLGGDYWQWFALRDFGINLMLIYAVVAWILGGAVFVFYLSSPRLSVFMKAFLIFTSFVYAYMTMVVLILAGLLDLVYDFRKPKKSGNES